MTTEDNRSVPTRSKQHPPHPARPLNHVCLTMVMSMKMKISTHSTTMHVMALPDFWCFSARTNSLTPSSTCEWGGWGGG